MNKLDLYIDELLIFMKNDIENNALPLNNTIFNFSLSTTEKFFNAEDEAISEGADLSAFRKIIKITDNSMFEKIFVKATNEGYIKNPYRNGRNYASIQLTDNGLRMAKALQLNKKSASKKIINFTTNKILLPIIVSVSTAIIVALVMSYIQQQKVTPEIEELKKEIKWIKQRL